MGTNPSAMLFYGYVWGENDVIEAETDVSSLINQSVTNPWDQFNRTGDLDHAAFR